jgi:hypothetical protein
MSSTFPTGAVKIFKVVLTSFDAPGGIEISKF